MSEPVRPRVGWIKRSGGETTQVRFAPVEPDEDVRELFQVVGADGKPVRVEPGDRLEVDAIGPGQGIKFATLRDLEGVRWERIDGPAV